MNEPHTVYIVDNDDDARDAVEALVSEMNLRYRSFRSAEEFLEDYQGERPGCLVTDLRMLQMSGLELQQELARRGITLAVVVITGYAETPVVVQAMKNGAVTLLEKPCRNYELWDAIRGGLLADAENLRREQQQQKIQLRFEKLTPAEKDVLDLVVAGMPNKTIARRLDVSLRTVEVRRQSLYAKLEADSVAELVHLTLDAAKAP